MGRERWVDALWYLAWAVCSSLWCLTAAAQIGPTFDEPIYLERGLKGWHDFSHSGLLQLGTMPLPVDVQTLPLYLWEIATDTPIDPIGDFDGALLWMRAGNLVFWWLLLWYALQTGRLLAGPWGGRLAVALLASEPNLLAHAALATTDIAISACLLALLYHFRVGREAGWVRRLAIPGLWFGFAILAKASAVVYGPICLVVVEFERLVRAGTFTRSSSAQKSGDFCYDDRAPRSGTRQSSTYEDDLSWAAYFRNSLREVQPAGRDLIWIGCLGLAVATIYCGSDFRTQPGFVEWAQGLPEGTMATCMVWLAENLCIFGNAAEGIVRQIKHNVRGHGTFLLGESYVRSVWFYFPVLLTIKLSLPVLLAPLAVAAVRARALTNWACLTALALLAFSLTFRVQIGIRLVLPLVSIGIVGLAAALVEAMRSPRRQWLRPALTGACVGGLLSTTIASAGVWPHGLCYVNAMWGGTRDGYKIVSDSNYDWGQGLPELLAWQHETGADLDVWYFGFGQWNRHLLVHDVPMHAYKVDGPDDVLSHLQARYFAVSTTMLYGQATALEGHINAVKFLRQCQPTARTTTFLIFERQKLADACQRAKEHAQR